jgi:hypothetical protein
MPLIYKTLNICKKTVWHDLGIVQVCQPLTRGQTIRNTRRENQHMKWLEIIELRCTITGDPTLKDQLTDMLELIHMTSENNRIKLFSSDTVETDFSIHIAHFSGPPTGKSKLGRHINMALKNFGLTTHKIWVVIENMNK